MQHLAERGQRKSYNYLLGACLHSPVGLNIHPSAFIRGPRNMEIGNNFIAGRHLWLEAVEVHNGKTFRPRIVIKNDVALNDFVHVAAAEYVEIGNNVLIASKVYISDHGHGTYVGKEQSNPEMPPSARLLSGQPIIIEDNVWIGEFVSVLKGVKIGFGSVIGSNSVVSKSIPPRSIAAGVPARVIKQFDQDRQQWIKV
jgi:lipopolysaccharide O-acetyltransferase